MRLAERTLPFMDGDAPWYERFELHAVVDAYVSANFGFPQPESRTEGRGGNAFRAFDVSNGFALHWAGADLSYPADPVGGTISLRFGPGATIYAGPDADDGLENLKQAYVSLRPGGDDGAFSLDFGKLDTPYGAEVADGQLNLDYTRGVLYAYAQPNFHTGLRATLEVAEALTLRALLVNGWNDTVDDNAGKTGGVQAVIAPAKTLTTYVGYLFGPEQPDEDDDGANARFKHLADVVIDVTPTDFLRVLVNADFGADKRPDADHALFYGVSVAARVAPIDLLGVAVRGEVFRDDAGWQTGVGEPLNLYTATLTVDLAPASFMKTMVDLRIDGASRGVFPRGSDLTAPTQVTATVGALVATP